MLCRETSVFTLQPHTGNGRDYICGNELSFQEVIMDLGLRAWQTQHGESTGDETWELRYRLCVYTVDLCTHKDGTHTHTQAHTTWLDICTNERALVDSAGVPGWGWISHHKISAIFKVPVWLEVMFSISVASLGLSYHHCCIYWQPCFIFCLGCPQNCLCSILYRLEMSLLSLAWVLKVPFLPAKGNRPARFYPPVCNHDLWTAQ